MFLIRH